jgi:hypothetical protein
MAWRLDEIGVGLGAGLAAAERAIAAEQAVHGLDALDEISLHPILARGIREAGFAVFRETPYPGQPTTLPKESQRQRCDLVIAPAATTGIADIVRVGKGLRLAKGTLFAEVAERTAAPPAGSLPPEDALWVEVKTIGQYTYVDGFAGPNRSYASQFNTCMADVRKLASGRSIVYAALALVLFNESAAVAEHDLTAFMHKCLDRDLPVAELHRESLPIADRIGNGACTVGLIRVRAGG